MEVDSVITRAAIKMYRRVEEVVVAFVVVVCAIVVVLVVGVCANSLVRWEVTHDAVGVWNQYGKSYCAACCEGYCIGLVVSVGRCGLSEVETCQLSE